MIPEGGLGWPRSNRTILEDCSLVDENDTDSRVMIDKKQTHPLRIFKASNNLRRAPDT